MINLKKEQEKEILEKMFTNPDVELNSYYVRLHSMMGVQVMRPTNCMTTSPPLQEPQEQKPEIVILKKGPVPKIFFSQRKLIKFIKQLIGFVENEETARKLIEKIDSIDTTIEGEIDKYEIKDSFKELEDGR